MSDEQTLELTIDTLPPDQAAALIVQLVQQVNFVAASDRALEQLASAGSALMYIAPAVLSRRYQGASRFVIGIERVSPIIDGDGQPIFEQQGKE